MLKPVGDFGNLEAEKYQTVFLLILKWLSVDICSFRTVLKEECSS